MTTTVKFTTMPDMMKASPFDPEHDLDRTLTKEIFFNELHIPPDDYYGLAGALHVFLTSRFEPHRVTLLTGYAGNGKTTFIHAFKEGRTDERSLYYDFTSVRPRSDNTADRVMRNYIRDTEGIVDTLRLISRHRHELKDYFSSDLVANLNASPVPDSPDNAWLHATFNLFDLRDTFACFFIHLFDTYKQGKKTVVYFDNLDGIPMEDLANHFMLYFQEAMSAAMYISRMSFFDDRNIDFRTNFRFVFCIREANGAILNAHLSGRTDFIRAPFEISFNSDFYRKVAEKRVKFVADNFPHEDVRAYGHGRFSAILGKILNDMYFREVFLPLYNNDYREVAGLLVSLIRQYDLDRSHEDVDFQLRGMLMFGVIRSLLTEDFLKDYRKIPANENGYCYIDRVMLTLLINCSNYRRYAMQQSGEPFSFFYLIKDLYPLYEVRTILNSIARCFLSQQLNRVHLITVLHRKVTDVAGFVDLYAPMVNEALSASPSDNVGLKSELSAVKVRINPAGFTYVRYVLPHFEFYSNIVGNTKPLFSDPLAREVADKKKQKGKEVYAFEAKIDSVLHQVRAHAKMMKKFFDNYYVPLHMNGENFGNSNYCFRHHGTSAFPVLGGGLSHTTRTVTAHVNYIDELRRRILRDPDLDADKVRAINESIISRIRRYVQVLQYAVDSNAARLFEEKFETHTRVIEQNLLDRATAIDKKESD
jgi:hypothetical protein